MATNTTITKNGKSYDYYRITRTVGHKIENGVKKPIKKQFVGTSKRDAEQKYQKWLKNETGKTTKVDVRKAFKELADEYSENILLVNSKYSYGTRELYSNAYKNHVRKQNIASQNISDLTTSDMQNLYNSLNISKSAMENVHKFLKGFFSWCSTNGYCDNLLSGIIIPDKKVVKRSDDIIVWTDEELKAINDSEPEYYLKGLILFAEYSGMRISELFGLKWTDIDTDNNRINIKRQYYRGVYIPPKGNKERIIPLHPKLKEYVENADRKFELVFCTKSGTPLDYNNTNRSIDRFYARNNIEHKKFHAYRATFCTNLCKKGVPIQTASKIMGHENITVTAKYYTSIDSKSMLEAISKI